MDESRFLPKNKKKYEPPEKKKYGFFFKNFMKYFESLKNKRICYCKFLLEKKRKNSIQSDIYPDIYGE